MTDFLHDLRMSQLGHIIVAPVAIISMPTQWLYFHVSVRFKFRWPNHSFILFIPSSYRNTPHNVYLKLQNVHRNFTAENSIPITVSHHIYTSSKTSISNMHRNLKIRQYTPYPHNFRCNTGTISLHGLLYSSHKGLVIFFQWVTTWKNFKGRENISNLFYKGEYVIVIVIVK